MTYDEQKAAQIAANKAIADKTTALLIDVAKALGGKWKEQETEHKYLSPDVYGTITLDGIAVYVRSNGYQNTDRIRFSISWPTYKARDGFTRTMAGTDVVNSQERAQYPWDITVSQAKPAATIAKDLMRRLVEPMRPVYALTLARIKHETEQAQREHARAAKFKKQFPNYTACQQDPARFYPGPGGMPRITLSDESIHLDQFRCDYATGYKILALLKTVKRAS